LQIDLQIQVGLADGIGILLQEISVRKSKWPPLVSEKTNGLKGCFFGLFRPRLEAAADLHVLIVSCFQNSLSHLGNDLRIVHYWLSINLIH